MQWIEGGVTAPQGFVAGAARGNIKTTGDDVALIVSETPAMAAAMFTQNRVQAAPVQVSREHVQGETARAIVVNAGNANCCTGAQGMADARRMCELAAQKVGCEPGEVLVCSTGIIGHKLPMDGVSRAIEAVELSRGQATDEAVARAFMTTDIVPKWCAAQAEIGGRLVTVGGQVKGVGMIGPDMAAPHATLLAFLTTDAQVEKPLLQEVLQGAVERSFNSVTVDGDTSTNDTALLLASGASGAVISDVERESFESLLLAVCIQLARKVARDGEGATKLVTVEVSGAATESDAKKIAMTVANSPLVKTAIFGRDPNWGRLAMAAGRAGVAFDPAKLSLHIGAVEVFRDGEPTNFSTAEAEAQMAHPDLTISVSLGEGAARWTAWTCDFSYDYVKINAEYHT